MTLWRIVNCGEGVHLASTTELKGSASIQSTIRTDITRGEDLLAAMRTDLSLEGIALFLQPPVA
jgi:hypothetical protein